MNELTYRAGRELRGLSAEESVERGRGVAEGSGRDRGRGSRRGEEALLVTEGGRGALGVSVELRGEVGVVDGRRVCQGEGEVCPVHL